MSHDDRIIETDVQFGVTRHLIGNYVRHENEPAPAPDVEGPWYSLDHTFIMEAGESQAAAAADHRQGARRRGRKSSGWRRRRDRRRKAYDPACAAARSIDAAVCPNRIARSSAVRMPPRFGLTAFALS